MIISASYRTDVPAFYGTWLMNRLRARFCYAVNPYNATTRKVSLSPEDVDGLVLWTKNIGPLAPRLAEISELGHAFYVQHSLTGYPRELEASVAGAEKSVAHIRAIAERWGPRSVVWRYDPVLITDLTDEPWHEANFAKLANQLRRSVDEVVVSFAQFYRKTTKNLKASAARRGFRVYDPSPGEKRAALARLAEIAAAHDMRLTVCAQPDLVPANASAAGCIDAARLSDLRGRLFNAARAGNRPGCQCARCVDIGDYDTCPHGCVYCYAVRERDLARDRHRRHDPQSESLFALKPTAEPASSRQLDLFEG